MIRVGQFNLHSEGDRHIVSCRVDGADLPDTLRFDVTGLDPTADACREPNWVAVALLYPAMERGLDLEIDATLSPRLLFHLQRDLPQLLTIYDPGVKRVAVRARAAEGSRGTPSGRVATGFSAGIDSFATLLRHAESDVPRALRVTDLAVFNVGAMGDAGAPEVRTLFEKYHERCRAFAAESGYGSVSVSSNLGDFFLRDNVNFARTHTLRNIAAALLAERSLDYFIYASSVPYAGIRAAPSDDMSDIDPILLPLLSTERLQFLSGVATLSRGEKTALLADNADAQRLLDVCVAAPKTRIAAGVRNCSRCFKCRRTLVTLDALGVLDRFGAVFDVDHYRRNRKAALETVARLAMKGSPVDLEAALMAREAGLPIRFSRRVRLGYHVREWMKSRMSGEARRVARRLRRRLVG